MVVQKYVTPRYLILGRRRGVLIVKSHHGSSYPSKQPHPCSWYTHHLILDGLRQVLKLRHGYSICQPHKFCVDALERSLYIHTHDVISSSPLFMMREALKDIMVLHMHTYDRMSLCVVTQKHVF